MRTLFRLTALTLAAVACAVFVWSSLPAPVPEMPHPQASPAATAPAAEARFAAFPVGVRVPVEVAMDSATSSRLSPRERTDQVRDWLLLTAVGTAGLTADEFNRATFDLPPTRHGYQREVAQFEYGVTRACHLGGGVVLALIPADAPAADRADRLAHVADEYRKTLGGVPATLEVFDYALPSGSEPAYLTRRDPVSGASLFTEAAGYHEATVRTPGELTAFLAAAPDLTFAKLAPSGGGWLELGGRRTFGRAYRGLRTEDVAAVWQAQKKLTDTYADFEKRYEEAQRELNAEANRKFQAAIQRIKSGQDDDDVPAQRPRFVGGRGRVPAEARDLFDRPVAPRQRPWEPGSDLPGMLGASGRVATKKAQYEAELQVAIKELTAKMSDEAAGGLKDGTGFSLDPAYDYAGLAKWFASESAETIEKPTGGEDGVARLVTTLKRQRGGVAAGLGRRDERPFLILKAELAKSDDLASQVYAQVLESASRKRFQYQAARYDGDLQGTEIGMVLFYTDLVAKLWQSVDFGSPKRGVPGFPSNPDGGNAPIYEQQTRETGGTRLWFGKDDRAFVLTDAPALLFARTSTRIFAASSSELTKDKEVPPIQASVHTIGWWNDHFEEVARHEPEYERLNEYIKWSQVLAWLTHTKQMDALRSLAGVTVDRNSRFPEWAARHPELKFQDWKRVGFHPPGHLGCPTEAMPLLFSRDFADYGGTDEIWQVSGGVSGGRPLDFAKMPVLRETAAREAGILGRGIDAGKLGPNSLTTLRGAEHTFPMAASPQVARSLAAPKVGLPQQAAHAQLSPVREFSRATTLEAGGGLRVRTAAGELPLADFTVSRTANGFRVGAESRGLDAALSVGREASAARQPIARTLAEHPQVEHVIAHADGSVTAKLAGSDQWVRYAVERTPTATVPEGVAARVAAETPGAKSLQVAVVEPGAVLGGGARGESIRLDLGAAATPGGPAGLPPVRGPPTLVPGGKPPTGTPVTLHHGADKIPGVFDGRYVDVLVKDLPASMQGDPMRLDALGKGGRPVNGVIEVPAAGPQHPAVELLASGNREAAAQKLAASPEGFAAARADRVTRGLADADRLLAGGKLPEATEALRTVEVVAGRKLPEAELRRGLAEFAAGRSNPAAERLTAELATAPGKPSAMGKFLDEVNRQLTGRRLTAPERATAVGQARVAHARDLVASGKTTAAVKAEAVGDKVELHAALATAEVERSKAGAEALLNGKETVYVDDALKLGVSDGGAGPGRTVMSEAVSSGRATMHEFHNADAVLATRPGVIEVGKLTGAGARGGHTFRAHGEVLPSRPFHLTHSATGAATAGGGSGGGDDEPDDDESEDEQLRRTIRKLFGFRDGDALGAVVGNAVTLAPKPAGRVFVLVAR